jgi:hypothetical protein
VTVHALNSTDFCPEDWEWFKNWNNFEWCSSFLLRVLFATRNTCYRKFQDTCCTWYAFICGTDTEITEQGPMTRSLNKLMSFGTPQEQGISHLLQYSLVSRRCITYEGVSKSFLTESITKSTTTINTRWEVTQKVMAPKLTRLTHKITIQLHLAAESCTVCSFRSKWPVLWLLDTPSYAVNKTLNSSRNVIYSSSELKYKWSPDCDEMDTAVQLSGHPQLLPLCHSQI